MIDQADLADPMVIARLKQREPHSVVVGAQTGEGIADALALIEDELPRPDVEFSALLPYERGGLDRACRRTARSPRWSTPPAAPLVSGRANEDLAGQLAAYSV